MFQFFFKHFLFSDVFIEAQHTCGGSWVKLPLPKPAIIRVQKYMFSNLYKHQNQYTIGTGGICALKLTAKQNSVTMVCILFLPVFLDSSSGV